MLKKAYYNGHDLTQHMTIKRVTTPFSGKITNTYGALPGTNHHWLQSSSRGQCVVEIEAVIKDDVLHHVDELNKILSVDEDGWLFFADQPDRKLLCRLDGTVTPSSRIAWATIKLKFVSPNSYWNATEGYKEARFANNSVIVDNKGTAETYPIVTVDFKADCGFLALQGPDGGMYLGNPEEIDKVDLKPSELALNKVFTDINGWQKVTGPTQFWDQYLEKYFHQHASSPVFSSWGMKPNIAELPANESYWQGHGYYKDFERGNLEVEADNFIIKSRVDMMDLSGRTNNTGIYWIMVSDSENKPVMAIYLQDQGLNKNEITISCMIASSDNPDPKKLTLVQEFTMPAFSGYLTMKKTGNLFEWWAHNDRTELTVTQAAPAASIQVGDMVHIAKEATNAETGHPILAFTRGRTYRVDQVRGTGDKRSCLLTYQGTPVYWIYEKDIAEYRNRTTATKPGVLPDKEVYTWTYSSAIAQKRATKAMVYIGAHGKRAYSKFAVRDIEVRRTYDSNVRDLKNVFTAGDRLQINNISGGVLLNGATFKGAIDYDSKFFSVGPGQTELKLVTSSWAQPVEAIVEWESRWL